jgi:hypothetical protein
MTGPDPLFPWRQPSDLGEINEELDIIFANELIAMIHDLNAKILVTAVQTLKLPEDERQEIVEGAVDHLWNTVRDLPKEDLVQLTMALFSHAEPNFRRSKCGTEYHVKKLTAEGWHYSQPGQSHERQYRPLGQEED